MSINNLDTTIYQIKNLNVLYIGHNLNTIKDLAKYFNRVYFENTKEKYLKTFEDKQIDFIIADFNALRNKGLELNLELKQMKENIPFILLLPNTDLIYYVKSLNMKIDGYLMNEFCEKQIGSLINNHYKKIDINLKEG